MLYIYAKFSENLITRILGPITRKFDYSKIASKVRVSSTSCSTVESLEAKGCFILYLWEHLPPRLPDPLKQACQTQNTARAAQ